MGIEAFLLKAQLRWVSHVMRMPDSWIPEQVFLGQLAGSGGPKMARTVGACMLSRKMLFVCGAFISSGSGN